MKKPKAPKFVYVPKPIRLNKFISNSGLCNRREADALIKEGEIKVNGKVVKELGTKVTLGTDVVTYKEKPLAGEAFVYVIFNKPKNTLTVGKDPQGKPNVIDMASKACTERIFPVGQLDKENTGLILLTNDMEMSKRLAHPDYYVERLYHIVLDKTITEKHMKDLLKGIPLEDGLAKVDEIRYVGDDAGPALGVRLSVNRKRIVKNLFEHLGYEVEKMDRVIFSGITKKDLPRGRWRVLSDKEVSFLKMANR
jgi:23S rRNA pseudouridine2605 synthase